MSQPWQQQPPQPGNPYGRQQPGGQPPQQPYGDQGGFPPPAPSRQGNVGLAIGAGAVAMLVGAGVYGAILKASDGAQIGYLAIGVGALIGAALGKLGGRNPALPVVGIVLGLLGVYFGQILGYALAVSDLGDVSVVEALTKHLDIISEAWKEELEPIDALFYGLAGFAGFSVTKKLAG
ncbi:hypothetical protein [Streptomyces sp. 8N706]|uniref:hypothetical protein n=1 Tax=Streptomyces sp. 8N706 TaxID=3457416 RepID=UPI003FD285B8